jgi:hypothetical protein
VMRDDVRDGDFPGLTHPQSVRGPRYHRDKSWQGSILYCNVIPHDAGLYFTMFSKLTFVRASRSMIVSICPDLPNASTQNRLVSLCGAPSLIHAPFPHRSFLLPHAAPRPKPRGRLSVSVPCPTVGVVQQQLAEHVFLVPSGVQMMSLAVRLRMWDHLKYSILVGVSQKKHHN